MGAGHGEERESVALMGKGVENLGYFGRRYFENLVEGKKERKRKRKR